MIARLNVTPPNVYANMKYIVGLLCSNRTSAVVLLLLQKIVPPLVRKEVSICKTIGPLLQHHCLFIVAARTREFQHFAQSSVTQQSFSILPRIERKQSSPILCPDHHLNPKLGEPLFLPSSSLGVGLVVVCSASTLVPW